MRAFLESTFGLLFEKGGNYSKTTIELLKLKLAAQSANLVSFILIRLMIFMFLLLVVFLTSIGLSLFIGELLGKLWSGFIIVSLLNLGVGFLLFAFRNNFIKGPIIRRILRSLDLKKDIPSDLKPSEEQPI